jgi:hypothetical protein
MLDGAFDGTAPLKAAIAVAGRNGNPRDGARGRAGTVDVELRRAESVSPCAVAAVDELGAEHVA